MDQPSEASLDQLCIDTIRTLSMDAVQKANSGHPGTAMALAPLAYTLWQRFLRYDPRDTAWPNRDRFVLSCGHASMLLYSLLHLAGVRESGGGPAVSLDDIKRFRQLDSKCPGHPEYGLTAGVETTTGPLGQGCATSIGMAIAGKWLGEHFNRPGFQLFDYDVYAICSDGDMMEGVSSEAASLAGHLRLGNLCWIYDNNNITIDGTTEISFGDEMGARFAAYGWNVARIDDANDAVKIAVALRAFRDDDRAPTLVIIDSHIGYGSPNKHDTSAAHGEPLGEDEVRLTKRFYGWPEEAHFLVPDGVRGHFDAGIGQRGRQLHDSWNTKLAAYQDAYPELARELTLIQNRQPNEGWDANLPLFPADPKGVATRVASGKALNAIAPLYPWMIGGAADLATSTQTGLTFPGAGDFEPGHFAGRNLHFGIREHVMAATLNGLALSGLRPFGSTYLIFSDYMKPAIRLSALMEIPVVYIFTHDSIGVGEDGPTHQPIEQLITLRATPGLVTIRPADANEVVEAWRVIVASRRPVALILSRQAVPICDRARYAAASGLKRGAYVLAESKGRAPEALIVATGSAVAICLEAYEALIAEGVGVRVVSMPSWDLFEAQPRAYRDDILPPAVKARVSVEEGGILGWDRYVGATGAKIGMRGFGASAPSKELMKMFGFTAEKVVEAVLDQLALAE